MAVDQRFWTKRYRRVLKNRKQPAINWVRRMSGCGVTKRSGGCGGTGWIGTEFLPCWMSLLLSVAAAVGLGLAMAENEDKSGFVDNDDSRGL